MFKNSLLFVYNCCLLQVADCSIRVAHCKSDCFNRMFDCISFCDMTKGPVQNARIKKYSGIVVILQSYPVV